LLLVLCQPDLEKEQHAGESGEADIKSPPSALIDPWQPALLLPGPVAALEAYVAAEMVIQFRAPCFEQTTFCASTQLTLAMRKHPL
jgi:hypothetical protein